VTVDAERALVYAAELAAFDGTDLEAVVGAPAVAHRIAAIVAGEWWPGTPVRVVSARSDARSSSTRCDPAATEMGAVIRLAASQATLATGAHELAHALAGTGAGHRAVFRAAYLDVVAVLTNADPTDRRHRTHVDQLAAAFAASGLSVGPRRWPEPPAATTGAIAL
jgi:hypothetical protein